MKRERLVAMGFQNLRCKPDFVDFVHIEPQAVLSGYFAKRNDWAFPEENKIMIRRFAPTYTYTDPIRRIRMCHSAASAEIFRSLAWLCGVRYVFLFERARVALYPPLKAYDRPGGVLMPACNCIKETVPNISLPRGIGGAERTRTAA
jgi:hypothetical protein